MKLIDFTVLTLSMFLSAAAMSAQPLYVGEFNIRNDNAKDAAAGNGWAVRCPVVCDILKVESFDIFGTQEGLHNQLEDMHAALPDYNYVGVGRNDGKTSGEYAAIFYNSDRVKCLSNGHFWLSETPEVVGSVGWDAKYTRICTWGQFKDKKTGNKFYYVNTHLDHRGKEAQKNGLKLIVERIGSINPEGYPMVLTGDFNIKPDNAGLVDLDTKMQSARKVAEKTDSHNTFNGWSVKKTDMIIDYIYVSGFSSCPEYKTVTEKYVERPFVSDHYPIISRLIF